MNFAQLDIFATPVARRSDPVTHRDAEMSGSIDGDLFDKLTAVAEEFPSAFLAGNESFDRMLDIAIEMGPMANG